MCNRRPKLNFIISHVCFLHGTVYNKLVRIILKTHHVAKRIHSITFLVAKNHAGRCNAFSRQIVPTVQLTSRHIILTTCMCNREQGTCYISCSIMQEMVNDKLLVQRCEKTHCDCGCPYLS